MALSIREQIITSLIAAFPDDVGDAFEGYTIERNSDAPAQSYPALVFLDGPQVASHDNSGITFYTMSLAIEGYVTSTTREAIGTDLNALYALIVIAATADHTIGGYAIDIRETDMDPQIENEGSKYAGAVSVGFEIDFMTAEKDPTTLAP